RFSKEYDKDICRMAYRVSSAVKPIDNTLRMVYVSKPETSSEHYEPWLQLEQSVLNTRALVLDALSFANELRREQALRATISPSYQRPSDKESVFGNDLDETIKKENETNKLLPDATLQKRRAFQVAPKNKYSSNLNFKFPSKFNNSKEKNNKYCKGKSQFSGSNMGNSNQGSQNTH